MCATKTSNNYKLAAFADNLVKLSSIVIIKQYTTAIVIIHEMETKSA